MTDDANTTTTNDTATTEAVETTTTEAPSTPAKEQPAPQQAAKPAPDLNIAGLDFMLPKDESIPSKYHGKTLSDLAKAYRDASSLIGTKDESIKTLESQLDEAKKQVAAAPTQDYWQDVLSKSHESKGAPGAEIIDDVASKIGVDRGFVKRMLAYEYQESQQFQQKITDAVGMPAADLVAKARESGLYSSEDFEAFDRLARQGSIEPFRMMKSSLEEAGKLEPSNGSKVPGLNTSVLPGARPPTRGKPAQFSGEEPFSSKSEYLSALSKANSIGKPAEREEARQKVAARLSATRDRNW